MNDYFNGVESRCKYISKTAPPSQNEKVINECEQREKYKTLFSNMIDEADEICWEMDLRDKKATCIAIIIRSKTV